MVYAQEALSAIVTFANERFFGSPTTTLIRDLKDIKNGLLGPVDYELMEYISLVYDRLTSQGGYQLLSPTAIMNAVGAPTTMVEDWRMSGMNLSSTYGLVSPVDIGDVEKKREVRLKHLYTNILLEIITKRLKANPDIYIYDRYLGVGQNSHAIFEILLSEFDLDFVKEVLQ